MKQQRRTQTTKHRQTTRAHTSKTIHLPASAPMSITITLGATSVHLRFLNMAALACPDPRARSCSCLACALCYCLLNHALSLLESEVQGSHSFPIYHGLGSLPGQML